MYLVDLCRDYLFFLVPDISILKVRELRFYIRHHFTELI